MPPASRAAHATDHTRLRLVGDDQVHGIATQAGDERPDRAYVAVEARRTHEVRLALDGDTEVAGGELDVGVVADDDDVIVVGERSDEVADPLFGPTAAVAGDDVEHADGAR